MPCRWYPSMPCRSPGGWVSQHALQVSRPTPRGKVEGSGRGVSRPTPSGVSRPTPGGFSRPTYTGVYPSMHWGRPPPDDYCRGRYACYWNAFLLKIISDVRRILSVLPVDMENGSVELFTSAPHKDRHLFPVTTGQFIFCKINMVLVYQIMHWVFLLHKVQKGSGNFFGSGFMPLSNALSDSVNSLSINLC